MAQGKTKTKPVGIKPTSGNSRWFTYIYSLVFAILVAGYLAESLLPEPDKLILHKYNLSISGYHWIIDSLVIFLAVIWVISFYGSMRIRSYARLIRSSPDGAGMAKIADGLLILTLSLPLTADISYLLNHAAKSHLNLLPTVTIINNYLSLVFTGLSFMFIAYGAHLLYQIVRQPIKELPQTLWHGAFILLSSLYGYFIITQPVHTPLAKRAYYLPDWLLVLTIAAPYMFFWYLGIRGAYDVFLFRANIKGSVYRSSLTYLAAGISVVVLGSVLTRIITSISTSITSLKLTPLLLVIYGLIAVIAIGYILIALGAKKLRGIEEA